MIRVSTLLVLLSASAACAQLPEADDVDAETTAGLFTFGDFLSGNGIEHLEVCILDTDNCDHTDADGFATLSVPANADIAVTIVGGGYASTIMPLRTTSEELVIENYLAPFVVLELGAAGAGLEQDDAKGFVAVSMVDASFVPVEGYAVTPSGGEGPYYLDALGSGIDLGLDHTSAAGRFFVMNVDAGSLSLTVDGPGTCWPRAHYWQRGPNEAAMPIMPGFVSGVMMECD